MIRLKRTGFAELPLHDGRAPQWLVERMIKLAREIVAIIIDEYGREIFLQRVSDPYWFQAFGCVLGYDWHSSGVTTVVTGVLKTALKCEDFGIVVCGGKGKASKETLSEIVKVGEAFNLSSGRIESLQYASRMSAKVDNSAIQAGYPLYHHAFFVTEDGKWAVIQQGMNVNDRTARRYHWLSDHVKNFVIEPHKAIVGDARRPIVLDMTARESEECRKTSVDIAKERTEKVVRMFEMIRPACQRTLQEWIPELPAKEWKDYVSDFLSMPFTINWKALKRAYEIQPRNYEELLGIKGVGPSTIRGLALVAEIIYGDKPSWRDPVKYSFAYGGKDGVPYPVDRKAMDESINILREAVEKVRLGDRERLNMLQKLRRFVPPDAKI
ncbi:MAG: DUF763 domain-containing protein [Candidatus Bathyarchaeia archaeon]